MQYLGGKSSVQVRIILKHSEIGNVQVENISDWDKCESIVGLGSIRPNQIKIANILQNISNIFIKY